MTPTTHTTFAMGDEVQKIKGSQWHGHIVGTYSTALTPEGYAVESSTEKGSVQIYPAAALELVKKAEVPQLAAAQQGVQPEWRAAFKEAVYADLAAADNQDVPLEDYADRILKVLDSFVRPAPQGLDAQTKAARSVLAERARQVTTKGWTPESDDNYNPGVLALHGGLYACHAYDNLSKKRAPEGWLWAKKWWKPKDPRTNLVKAGALILAEIERMDRSFAAQAKQGGV